MKTKIFFLTIALFTLSCGPIKELKKLRTENPKLRDDLVKQKVECHEKQNSCELNFGEAKDEIGRQKSLLKDHNERCIPILTRCHWIDAENDTLKKKNVALLQENNRLRQDSVAAAQKAINLSQNIGNLVSDNMMLIGRTDSLKKFIVKLEQDVANRDTLLNLRK